MESQHPLPESPRQVPARPQSDLPRYLNVACLDSCPWYTHPLSSTEASLAFEMESYCVEQTSLELAILLQCWITDLYQHAWPYVECILYLYFALRWGVPDWPGDVWSRGGLKLEQSSQLNFLSAGIVGMHQHTGFTCKFCTEAAMSTLHGGGVGKPCCGIRTPSH